MFKVTLQRLLVCSIALSANSGLAVASEKADAPVIEGKEAHGGKSVVCRKDDGTIASAELLDFYEGRIQSGLSLTKTNDRTRAEQLKHADEKFRAATGEQPWIAGYPVERYLRFLPADVKLEPTADSLNVIVPKKCAIEQLASYVNDETIYVDSEIWAALSETDRAGLLAHEAIYREERLYGATDSRHTRLMVALLFSDRALKYVKDEVPIDAGICTMFGDFDAFAGMTQFVYYPKGDKFVFQFLRLAGQLTLEKTTAEYDGNFPVVMKDNQVSWATMVTARSENIASYNVLLNASRKDLKSPETLTGRIFSSPYPDITTKGSRLHCLARVPNLQPVP